MKKALFIAAAAAALVAFASCTKVEKAAEPQQAIGFQVASYAAQTKADATVSILGETDSFTTYAWQYANDSFTAFMNPETIAPDSKTDPTEWAPSHVYYWPKTGYINFYSYYGSQAPAVTNGTLKYEGKTIAATDNLVFANPAFNQTQNLSLYKKNSVSAGVPTLFHHALCQIAFDIKAGKTTDEDGTTWEITVDEAKVVVDNKGTLSLSKTLPAATAEASNPEWDVISNTSKPLVGWTPAESTETIAMTALGTNKITTTAQDLLAYRAAMPQVLDDTNVFTIKYTIVTKYEGTKYAQETITTSAKLTDFSDAITEWDMNKKIIYHVTITPGSDKILFDPAVVDWVPVTGGTISL